MGRGAEGFEKVRWNGNLVPGEEADRQTDRQMWDSNFPVEGTAHAKAVGGERGPR